MTGESSQGKLDRNFDRMMDVLSKVFHVDRKNILPETHFERDLHCDNVHVRDLVVELNAAYVVDNKSKLDEVGDLPTKYPTAECLFEYLEEIGAAPDPHYC